MIQQPHLFVVFGGTGDLMRRKLLPALHSLCIEGRLAQPFSILAVARSTDYDDVAFRTMAQSALVNAGVEPSGLAGWCDSCLAYQSIGRGQTEDFHRLSKRIEGIEASAGLPGNRLFYLALGPSAFKPTIRGLGETGLNTSAGWCRVVVEKPFGRDFESAKALNAELHRYFDENQIYRIDHYLGKETVQNLLVFRFANPMFESVWNRDRVKSIQITVAEDLGVGSRAGYYDRAGALRDMVQNHLTQLLTLSAMEAPAAFEADAIRDEKVKVLRALGPVSPSDAVFGQYSSAGRDGHTGPGYPEETDVKENSQMETFVALRLEVNNWRWQGVPFYLRTGKRMARRLTQIVVNFHVPPVSLFQPYPHCQLHSNSLVLTLQPDEGFALGFDVKTPGQDMVLETQNLHFGYEEVFGPLPDGYQTLLSDVMEGDQTLFVRADEVETSWAFYQSLLDNPPPLDSYAQGTWGPQSATRLVAENGNRWHSIN